MVPNLIAFDVMAVQAMDTRVGMVNYMDYQYSKSKGQTVAGDVFNSSINMGVSDELYTTDKVKMQPIGVAGNTDYGTADMPLQLNWWPVRMDTFTVQVGDSADPAVFGTVTSIDSYGVGHITGTGITSGTISPDGKLAIKFAAATADVPVVDYNFDNESVRSNGPVQTGFTNVPEIELKINSLPVTAKARTLRSYWAFDAALKFSAA